MRVIFYTLILFVTIVSCGSPEEKPHAIEQASWLIGQWENASAEGHLTETWIKENDSTFSARTFFIKGTDTLHNETIALNEADGTLIYTPIVIGQNNNKPVPFRLASATDSTLVFENPRHSYPQKIEYHRITADSIVAKISGIQHDKQSSDVFPMSRVSN